MNVVDSGLRCSFCHRIVVVVVGETFTAESSVRRRRIWDKESRKATVYIGVYTYIYIRRKFVQKRDGNLGERGWDGKFANVATPRRR